MSNNETYLNDVYVWVKTLIDKISYYSLIRTVYKNNVKRFISSCTTSLSQHSDHTEREEYFGYKRIHNHIHINTIHSYFVGQNNFFCSDCFVCLFQNTNLKVLFGDLENTNCIDVYLNVGFKIVGLVLIATTYVEITVKVIYVIHNIYPTRRVVSITNFTLSMTVCVGEKCFYSFKVC